MTVVAADKPAETGPLLEAPAAATSISAQRDRAWVAWVTAACFLFGVMVALAVRTTIRTRASGSTYYQSGIVGAMLHAAREQNQELQKQLATMSQQLNEFQKTAQDTTAQQAMIRDQFQDLKLWAGLVPVKGPGLRILLRDSPVEQTGIPPDLRDELRVHDNDLNGLVNELRSAGAEALAIGGADGTSFKRLVHNSAARCVGPSAVVNGAYLSAPYTILAIGSPENLRSALEMSDGFIASRGLKDLDMIQIETSKELHLPAYAGPTTSTFSRAATSSP